MDEANVRDGLFYKSDLLPHRLLAYTNEPLPVRQLIGQNWFNARTERLCTFLPSIVFPRLNPQELIQGNLYRQRAEFDCVGSSFDPSFLHQWTDLERIVIEGEDVVGCYYPPRGFTEIPLVSYWAAIPQEEKRRVEVVYDFTSLLPRFLERMGRRRNGSRRDLEEIIDPWKMMEMTTLLVDISWVLKVRLEDEEIAREKASELKGWMKKLVRVEAVS